MKLKKFQNAIGELFDESVTMGAFFLAEEAGEVSKELKRAYKDNDTSLDQTALAEELGDVMVALAVLSNAANFSLDDIAKAAVEKWQNREEEESGS